MIGELCLWGGDVLSSSPVDQVWAARNDIDHRDVACLLSLGTGHADIHKTWGNVFSVDKTVIDYATETESKHKDFEHEWKSLQLSTPECFFLYARLDVPTHDKSIRLDSFKDMKILKTKTDDYLETYTARKTIDCLAKILRRLKPTRRYLPSVQVCLRAEKLAGQYPVSALLDTQAL